MPSPRPSVAISPTRCSEPHGAPFSRTRGSLLLDLLVEVDDTVVGDATMTRTTACRLADARAIAEALVDVLTERGLVVCRDFAAPGPSSWRD